MRAGCTEKMITLDPYQQAAVDFLATKRRAAVQSPAGSGKTIIAAAALCRVVTSRPRPDKVKIGWLANTLEQCQQARDALAKFPTMTQKVDVRIACAAADTDWSDRDVLIVDECHHGIAPQWSAQISTCKGALWGFTATPPEDEELLAKWREMFGNSIHVVQRLAAASKLSKAVVVLLPDTDAGLDVPIDTKVEKDVRWREKYFMGGAIGRAQQTLWTLQRRQPKPDQLIAAAEDTVKQLRQRLWGQVAWQTCIDIGIVENRARNAAAVATARRHASDSVLLLVNKIEHGEALCGQIPGAVMCFSKMGKKKRREAIESFKTGKCRCLVATSLADEGLDVPIANVLILVSGGRSTARTEQRTGRVLRVAPGKTHGLIYDFKDEWHSLAAKHSRRRVEIYRSLDYHIQGEL